MQKGKEMSNYISTRDCTTNGYICAYVNALENSLNRAKYYEQNDDIRFLNESNDWITVAGLYMKEILNKVNN